MMLTDYGSAEGVEASDGEVLLRGDPGGLFRFEVTESNVEELRAAVEEYDG